MLVGDLNLARILNARRRRRRRRSREVSGSIGDLIHAIESRSFEKSRLETRKHKSMTVSRIGISAFQSKFREIRFAWTSAKFTWVRQVSRWSPLIRADLESHKLAISWPRFNFYTSERCWAHFRVWLAASNLTHLVSRESELALSLLNLNGRKNAYLDSASFD